MLRIRRTPFWACIFIALSFVNQAFAQRITTITPSSVQAGSSGFVITVAGSNFDSESKVRLHTANGIQPLETYFINTGLLMAGVYSNDIVNPGTIQVDVANYDTESASAPVNLYVLASGSGGSGGSGGTGGSGGGGGSGASTAPASLISPVPGSIFTGSSEKFQWTAGTGATQYVLGLGTTGVGSYNLFNSGYTTALQITATNLPTTGVTIYARLFSMINGVWEHIDYTYTSISSNPGAPTTSPSGSDMLVTVTSPSHNQSVNGTVTVAATAASTSLTDGGIAFWGIFDSGKLLWTDINPDPSINVNLALSAGSHNLQISAYDDSYTASTASVPVVSSSSGVTVGWQACMYTAQGQQYQAMRISPSQPVTGVLQAEMFSNSNCDPVQFTDQLNDYGSSTTFGAGFDYLYYFIHRANTPNVSAVWTIGNQTSGCVNYNAVPAC